MSPRLKPTVLAAGGGASGRPLGHEGGALLNGTSALVTRAPESPPFPFLPSEDSTRGRQLAARERALARTPPCRPPIADFRPPDLRSRFPSCTNHPARADRNAVHLSIYIPNLCLALSVAHSRLSVIERMNERTLNAIFVTFSPTFKMLAKQESYVAFSIAPHSRGHIVGGQ